MGGVRALIVAARVRWSTRFPGVATIILAVSGNLGILRSLATLVKVKGGWMMKKVTGSANIRLGPSQGEGGDVGGIKGRLRIIALMLHMGERIRFGTDAGALDDAVAEIERLEARVAGLAAALRDVIEHYDSHGNTGYYRPLDDSVEAARAALAAEEGEGT